MKSILAVAILAGALGAAGCATTEPQAKAAANSQASAAPKAAKSEEMLTGSRIPRKTTGSQPVVSISDDEIRRNSAPEIYIAPK
ncbi:MAG: hypothetical protein IPP91_17200 [Betaproteobacteria bacterium]|nr:hypothetical protein [Betaproteobacteria bacterium]